MEYVCSGAHGQRTGRTMPQAWRTQRHERDHAAVATADLTPPNSQGLVVPASPAPEPTVSPPRSSESTDELSSSALPSPPTPPLPLRPRSQLLPPRLLLLRLKPSGGPC